MATLYYDETNDEVIDPSKFTPLPAGKYEAMIVESDTKPCQTAPMDQLVLVWQVTSGEYEGRKVWDRINMRQSDTDMANLPVNYQKAILIGQKSLNTIFQALGKRAGDSAELHEIPCIIDVRIRPAKDQYPASNEIRNYISLEAAEQAASLPPAPTKNPPAVSRPTGNPAAAKAVATVARNTPAAKKPWQK